MKTISLNIILLLGVGFILLIPAIAESQSTFGIRAGLNATNISFDDLSNRSERLGWHAGLFADVPLVPDVIAIQPEISYSVKGTAYKPLTERRTLSFDYVDFLLPVAFKLGPVNLQVGPFASYLISNRDFVVVDNNQVVTDAFKKFDAGLTAGLSFNLGKVFIGVRYNQGLSDVTRENVRAMLGSGKNGVGQVSLGFRF